MKAIIVDPCPKSHEKLRELLINNEQEIQIIDSAYSMDEGFISVKELDPDLLFLGVEFPEGRLGFELLESLEPIDFQLIFISAQEKNGAAAVRFGALDYLLKPIALTALRWAVGKARQKHLEKLSVRRQTQDLMDALLRLTEEKLPSRIGISTQEGIFYKEVKDIIRLEAKESYTNIVFTPGQKEILASINLGEYEAQFKPYRQFMRVHRSNLVNLNYVEVYVKSDGGYLRLKNGESVDVSKRYRAELIQRLAKI